MSREFDDDDRIRPSRPPRARRPRDVDDDRPPRPRSSGTRTVLIVLGVVALLGCCCIAVPVGFVGYFGYKGFDQAREKQHVMTNFKQIGLGMHHYHDVNMKLPPIAMTTKSGKPGLSWRVAILPYVEQNELYKKFKIDQPWDHPDNLKLAAEMPAIYAPGREARGDKTHVRVFHGPEALYDPKFRDPRSFAAIADGLSSTIFCVEAEQAVLWIQPAELEFDLAKPLPKLGLAEQPFFVTTFCDGTIKLIKKTAGESNLKKAITPRNAEIVDLNFP